MGHLIHRKLCEVFSLNSPSWFISHFKPSKSQPNSWLIDIRDERLPCLLGTLTWPMQRKHACYESGRISKWDEIRLSRLLFFFVAYLTAGFKSLLLFNHLNLGGKDEPPILTNIVSNWSIENHQKNTKLLVFTGCCLLFKIHPSGWWVCLTSSKGSYEVYV